MFDWKKYEQLYNEQKDKVLVWTNSEFNKLQTGRASPAFLDSVKVEAYGDLMPINQIANINIPEPRSIVIKPYDKSTLKDIAAAINAANLGVNPQVDADLIRINFPAPTEESRKNLVKKAKEITEQTKVKIRLIRQEMQDLFKKEENVVDDDKKHFQNELDALTKKINGSIDELFSNKEKEIMKI